MREKPSARFWALLLSVLLCISLFPVQALAADGVIKGDCSGDGSVSLRDYLLLKNALANDTVTSLPNWQGADMDDTGTVNLKDLLMLKKYVNNASESDTEPTIAVDSVSATPGSEITVPVYLKNSPGLQAINVTITYNEANLTLTQVENGSDMAAVTGGTFIPPKDLSSGCGAAWMVTGAVFPDGQLMVLHFTVAANATGTETVTVTADEDACYDSNLDAVAITGVAGKITFGEETPANIYTVTFKDSDGSVLSVQTVEEGKDATAPAAPQKSGYLFTGWDKTFTNVTANLVVTAVYEENTQPTIFVDSVSATPGSEITVPVYLQNSPGLQAINVTIAYNEANLTLTQVENGSDMAAVSGGTFIPPKDLSSGCGAAWMTPSSVFPDGQLMVLHFTVAANATGTETVTVTADADACYDSNLDEVSLSSVAGKITLAEAAPVSSYTVTFKDSDGTVLSTQTVEAGNDATAPANPEKSGYVFAGWDKAFTNVTADLVVTAVYEEITEPTFLVDSVSATPGSEITVPVYLKNSPGLQAINVTITYNEANLTLTQVENGSDMAAGTGGTFIPPKDLSSGCGAAWMVTGAVFSDGQLMVLHFTVSASAAGTDTITVAAASEDACYDSDLNSVKINSIAGSIQY